MALSSIRQDLAGYPGGSAWLDAALAIGRQLLGDAQGRRGRLDWVGEDLAGNDPAAMRVVTGEVGPGLYSGSAGIGWFLAHLGAHAGDPRLLRGGCAALSGALADAEALLAQPNLSLFSGASGVALAALQVAVRLQRPGLRRRALLLAHQAAARAGRLPLPADADLIGGLAGIVVALAAIHRLAPHPRFVDACALMGEQLVHMRRECAGAACWDDVDAAAHAPGLCGLGHGASGIAWALYEAAELAGKREFSEVAAAAIYYERSWIAPGSSDWPDLRNPPSEAATIDWPGCMAAWCHGAIGIGALRWSRVERGSDMAMLAEAGASVHAARGLAVRARRALDQGQAPDVTLCHGLGGAVELLLLAYEVTGLDEHLRAARRMGDLCLDVFRVNRQNWTTGLAGTERVPGLMVGLAGIGAMMLRLHDISAIGSPLLPGRLALRSAAAAKPHFNSGPVETQASASA